MLRARFDEFEMDLTACEIRRRGKLVPLPLKAFTFLACLVGACGRVVTRHEIERVLWPDVFVETINSLNQAHNKVVKLVGQDRIETLRGVGYRFAGAFVFERENTDFDPDPPAFEMPIAA